MGLKVTLKYLKALGQGRYEFRRRVPESVKATIGKGEFKRVIEAKTDAELFRLHGLVLVEYDKLVRSAGQGFDPSASDRANFEDALKRADRLVSCVVGLDEDEARAVVAEGIAAAYPADPDDGSPLGVSEQDATLLRALMSPVKAKPGYSLADARDLYLKEKIGEGKDSRRHNARLRLARVMARAAEAGLPASTPLVDLKRQHARDIRDLMLSQDKQGGGKVSPASVLRDIGMLKAVITRGLLEFDLRKTVDNPFDNLDIAGTSEEETFLADNEKRLSLPDGVVNGVKRRLTGDLLLIWRLLDGTGCRLAEIIGLRVEDVCDLHGPLPHIRIRWHDERRLKNLSSIRSVPLCGDALSAAKEALEGAGKAVLLFPQYVRLRGTDAASAALMKHVRSLTKDKRFTVHSLRHNMKDKMRIAGVEKATQDMVLGHASGDIGEDYGSDAGRLAVTHAAMLSVVAKQSDGNGTSQG